MLIAFEGIDGAGKTTIIEKVAAMLKIHGVDTIVVREPGSTPFGEIIRNLIKDGVSMRGVKGKPAKAVGLAQPHLFMAAHHQLMDEVVRPAIAEGKVVLMDRNTPLSMIAYQVHGKKLDPTWINALIANATIPDATIWLDVPIDAAIARIDAARPQRDEFDHASAAFMDRVRQGYVALAISGAFGHWFRIDATQPQPIMCQRITNTLLECLQDVGIIA